jgi:hypothetical protein
MVRARKGYVEAAARRASGTSRASRSISPLAQMLAGILPNRDIPMQVAVAPFAVPGGRDAAVAIVLGKRGPVANSQLQVKAPEMGVYGRRRDR